jgi:hypothetical protein
MSDPQIVPLDKDGNLVKSTKAKNPRTRAPTPGRSSWDKSSSSSSTSSTAAPTPQDTSLDDQSSEDKSPSSSRNVSPDKKLSTSGSSKPSTPTTKKATRYTSPYRQRSSTSNASIKETDKKGAKEKSPRAGMKSVLGMFSKS